MGRLVDLTHLTAGQLRFAKTTGAQPATTSHFDAIYFYQAIDEDTARFLVNADGKVLEMTLFHRAA